MGRGKQVLCYGSGCVAVLERTRRVETQARAPLGVKRSRHGWGACLLVSVSNQYIHANTWYVLPAALQLTRHSANNRTSKSLRDMMYSMPMRRASGWSLSYSTHCRTHFGGQRAERKHACEVLLTDR